MNKCADHRREVATPRRVFIRVFLSIIALSLIVLPGFAGINKQKQRWIANTRWPPAQSRVSNPSVPIAGGALVVTDLNNGVSATDLANALVGTGVTISNVTYTGDNRAAGRFTGGATIVGFDSGIVLSSGNVQTIAGDPTCGTGVEGPNGCHELGGPDGVTNSTSLGFPGDPDLAATSGFSTADAATLEFDFVPTTSTVAVQFVFSSEEYSDYSNTPYNDIFGAYVNGVDYALLPGTSDPVSINTVNNGNDVGGDPTPHHPELYRENVQPVSINTQMDGVTAVFTCIANVNPGVTNHIKLAIADASDSAYDSAVFIKAQSLVSGTVVTTSLIGGNQSGPMITVPSPTLVRDSATLLGAHAANASGTLNYKIFSDPDCATLFADAGTKTVTGGQVPNSNSITFSSLGTYYWRAFYSGDSLNNASATSCGEETVTIGPPCLAPPTGMVAWYPGDGNANDIAGINNGTLVGVMFTRGVVGQAFNFSGGAVQIPDSPVLKITQNLTIDAWINFNGGSGEIVFRGDDRDGLDPYALELNAGSLRFHVEDANGNAENLEAPIPGGEWIHVAATLEDATGTMTLYVNGAVVAQTATAVRPFADLDSNQNPGLGIGNTQNQAVFQNPFNGFIDEVEIFSRTLSASEIAAIYNAGGSGKCKLSLVSAGSALAHGTNTFRVPLPLTGSPGIECRSHGGNYTVVLTFDHDVNGGTATTPSGTGSVAGVSFNGPDMIVSLSGVSNQQVLTLSAANVTATNGTTLSSATLNIGFLIGDTNADGAVNVADIGQTKSQSGHAVSGSNFREDVNVDNAINVADIGLVKSKSGTALP